MGTTGTATVLFTDLVASTELRSRVGQDGADELRHTHDALLTAAITRHQGQLVKGLGDGLMATFGSASDGVDAAVAIQQAIHQHNATAAAERLSVRVGLSTGDVVWETDDCFGAAVIEAARICAAAEGDQVLAADVVRILARQGGQAFRPIGDLLLKGLPDPVPATEVLWTPLEVALDTRPPMPELLHAGARLGFAGRAEELESLHDAWKRALSGERQVVLITGEPGIGKTRLSREVALTAHEQGAVVLYGRCEEDLGAPYQPFVEALDFFVTRSPAGSIDDRLGRYAAELARLCPAVALLVPGLDPPLKSDAETERYRLFEAIASWLAEVSATTGLVLVLDDLHWATRPTLVLLQHVLHAAPEAKLLIAGTYRDTDIDRKHPLFGLLADLRRQSGVSRLALTGLDGEGVRELVSHAAGHELDENGQQLAELVQRETEGNPFFVGEILRHLRESGAIFIRDDRWVSDLSASELGIPEGIREVVGRRLDRLSQNANDCLTVAAVVGRDFDLAVVSAAADLDEELAEAGLDEAVRARLIEETGVGEYRFSHALVRSTLYDELRATKRARMHARVGAAIEQRRPADTAALAHHFVQAGDADKGVSYSRRAGDEVAAQLAHDRAVDYYAQALELVDDRDDNAVRRCELLIALGAAQRRSGDPAYRATLLEAAGLAQRVGADKLLIEAALANSRGFWSLAGETDDERIAVLEAAIAVSRERSADRARLQSVLAVELMFGSQADRRHQLSEEAVALAREVGDQLALVDVLTASIPANFVPWRNDVTSANSAELIDITRQLGDPQRWALANLWRFVTHLIGGTVSEGDAHLEEAIRVAAELGEPALRWLVTSWSTLRTLMRGDLEQAEAQMQTCFELGTRTGQPDVMTWYAAQLWAVTRERGAMADLLSLVETEVANNPGLPAWIGVLAMIYVMVDRKDEARALLDQLTPDGRLDVAEDVMWISAPPALLDVAEHVGAPDKAALLYDLLLPFQHLPVHGGVAYLGSAERYLAMGARAMGRLDDAVAHCEAAVVFEERMDAKTWLGVALADLALTLRRRAAHGDLERADQLASKAMALAKETGSVFVEHRLAGLIA